MKSCLARGLGTVKRSEPGLNTFELQTSRLWTVEPGGGHFTEGSGDWRTSIQGENTKRDLYKKKHKKKKT